MVWVLDGQPGQGGVVQIERRATGGKSGPCRRGPACSGNPKRPLVKRQIGPGHRLGCAETPLANGPSVGHGGDRHLVRDVRGSKEADQGRSAVILSNGPGGTTNKVFMMRVSPADGEA